MTLQMLFSEEHIKQSRQFSLILCSTCVVGGVLSELCKCVSQEALGRVLRKVNCIPWRRELPTLVVAAPQRPSLPFESLVQDLRVTIRERNPSI
jgi:hypothetical protein